MDDFYEPVPNGTIAIPLLSDAAGLTFRVWALVLAAPIATALVVLSTPLTIVIATRLLSGRISEKVGVGNAKSVWMLSYWVPYVGHGFSFLWDPVKLMSEARDLSPHGIFALKLGPTTHNIISDPALVKGAMQQKESVMQFAPIAWATVEKFFAIPRKSKVKYEEIWDEITSYMPRYLMREPYLGQMLGRTIQGLEQNIPQMISFMESAIDQQPWERFAKAEFISTTEIEINLMSLMRDMMGHASVPSFYGKALMEQFPELLHDVYALDVGMIYFLMGLPRWTPIPAVTRAHLARSRVWDALIEYHKVLDATVDGKPVDSSWGDLDDVSELIWARHKIFKEKGFAYEERGDISILWAMLVNANLLVYWHIHHILATPGLLSRIRTEITPYASISKPVSIGTISEAPKLSISHEDLSKKCPLLKSSYLEALRMSSQPWSVRQIAGHDITISPASSASTASTSSPSDVPSYILREGEYVAMPHDLHMRDPRYFKDPEKFDPERFIVRNEDGSLATDMGTIRPYGGGPSMCKGRVFAERECLSLVAGVLAYWEIEPAGKRDGWQIPKQKKTTAISLPIHDTRVRIRRRQFDWDK